MADQRINSEVHVVVQSEPMDFPLSLSPKGNRKITQGKAKKIFVLGGN